MAVDLRDQTINEDGEIVSAETASTDLAHSAPLELERLSLDDVGKIGRVFAQSGYFKDAKDAAQAITKVLAGQEIGIPPFQAMAQFHVIEGKPTMSSALIGALVKRSGRYDYRVREHTNEACWIDWYEKGKRVGESRFTMEDAKMAGLGRAGSGWSKYPAAMLFARALTSGARMYCPDVFGGAIYTPEELGATVSAEGEYEPPTPPPPAPSATATPAEPTEKMASVAQRRLLFATSKDAAMSEDELRDLIRELTGQSSSERIPARLVDDMLVRIKAIAAGKIVPDEEPVTKPGEREFKVPEGAQPDIDVTSPE